MTRFEVDPNIVASSRATAFTSFGTGWPILVGLVSLGVAALIYLIFFNKDGMERVYARACTESVANQHYVNAVESCSAALAHRDMAQGMMLGTLYDRAEAYFALGDNGKAILDLNTILENRPKDLAARFLRAYILDDLGDKTGAIDDIKAILSSGSEDAKYYDLYAYLLSSEGKFTEAATALDKGLKHNPSDISLMNRQINALLNLENYDQALALANRALEQHPADPHALIGRTYVWLNLTEFAKARTDLTSFLKNDPNNSDARELRAYANFKLGALDAAEADIELSAINAWTMFIKERIRMDRGHTALFTKALKLDEDNPDIKIAKMAAWVSGRRYLSEEGIKAIRAEADLIRQKAAWSVDGSPLLCLVYAALADFGHAQSICDGAIAVAPKNGEAWRSRAFLKLRLGSYNDALADWKKALSISPEDAIAHFGQGYTMLLLNQEEDGRKSIERAKALNITISSYFDRWGFRPGYPPETPEALIPLR